MNQTGKFKHQISILDTESYVSTLIRYLRLGFHLAVSVREVSGETQTTLESRQPIVVVSRILGELAQGLENLYPRTQPPLTPEREIVGINSSVEVLPDQLGSYLLYEIMDPVEEIIGEIMTMANPISDSNLLFEVVRVTQTLDVCRKMLVNADWFSTFDRI